MSRDFTPKELLAFEQAVMKSNGMSIRDFMKGVTFTYNGETSPLYSSEAITLQDQFPLFGKLLNDFPSFHQKLSEAKGGLALLQEKEQALQAYIDTGAGDKDSALIKWFEGKLDECFYYSNENEKLFKQSVLEEAYHSMTEECFLDVKRQLEAHENETSYGEPQAFYGLPNGRSLEITLEQEGLPEEEQFYDVRLHCTEQEFDNNDFHAGNGVIAQYASANADINSVKSLLYTALLCNAGYPIAEHSRIQSQDKPSLTDQIEAAGAKTKREAHNQKQSEITR